ncbi:MAG: hypothetical protein ACREDH_15555 [Methylocella sp.]
MLDFLKQLFSRDDTETDAIILSGGVAMAALVAQSGYVTYLTPASFSPLNFATATVTIIAAIGGAKRLRDGAVSGGDAK